MQVPQPVYLKRFAWGHEEDPVAPIVNETVKVNFNIKPEIVDFIKNNQIIGSTKLIASVWTGTGSMGLTSDNDKWSLNIDGDDKLKFVNDGFTHDYIRCELVIDTNSTSLPNAELTITPLTVRAENYITIILKKIVTDTEEITF